MSYFNRMGFKITFDEWSKDFEHNAILQEVVKGRRGTVWISTVYIGLDHNFSDYGPPLIFETMAFEVKAESWNDVVGETDMGGIDQLRTSTEDQAKKAHAWFCDLYG